MGFQHSLTDLALFIYHYGAITAYLLLYVNDIILTASSTTPLQSIIDQHNREFTMTDFSVLNYFLAISVTYTTCDLFLSQRSTHQRSQTEQICFHVIQPYAY